VLLFPNFQRSFGFTAYPFFERECKGKGLFISSQIIFQFLDFFWREIHVAFSEELPLFLKRTAKIHQLIFTTNFFAIFLFFRLTPESLMS